ncbi:MAG: type II/IV secretion system ATPase subunit [Candidatus Aenigmarchaeota archaeon]|nr:type II/IV secretion system ATPase subunit [Candidatus Aenigmarchaeota archaeon]MDW8149717.1 type II/IV secretion system ATPase subunit [Candidatus Aenigmarchaeota archaeon]
MVRNLRKIINRARKGYFKSITKEEKVTKVTIEAPEVKAPYIKVEGGPIPSVGAEKVGIVEKKGIRIPEFSKVSFGIKEKVIEEEKVRLVYPLIPKTQSKDEKIYAYAKIYWDEKNHRYFYEVVEPKLTESQKTLLEKIKYLIEQKLDIDVSRLKKTEAIAFLRKNFEEIVSTYKIRLSSDEKDIFFYYIQRDYVGLGKIEPIIQDDNIEDISCDGVNIPIFVFHRNPKIGSVITNVVFENADELDSFVLRLAQLCGKSVSILNPFLNGSLPDGTRVQATLATDIARRGSNFTLRKFTQKPLTPAHLLTFNTLDVKSLAYLWLAVEYGQSVLVCGGTASGKTSLLNILSMFIKQDKKIVSIEDTAEIKLLHPHWVPHVARTTIATKEGEVDLFALLKESLRQRPDYIIVGEVRGPEAYVLFQEMATGHPSLATIHAENIQKLIDRLTTPPINLPPTLIQAVDILIFISQTRYREKVVRRITEIFEVIGFDRATNSPIVNLVFKWDALNDKFDNINPSYILRKISEKWGIRESELANELSRRMLVLNWVKEKNIVDYENFHKVILAYYIYPDRLIELIKSSS